MSLSDLGYKIRTLRRIKGLTQAALGKYLNISQKEISHYENNYRTPPPEILAGIARVLETSVADLYGEEEKHIKEPVLKKSTIWLIAEKLEELNESERKQVLKHINGIIASRNRKNIKE